MKKIFLLLVIFCGLNSFSVANEEYLVLITGCGRSGTKYTAELLTKAGLPIGHERLASGGSVSWFAAVNAEKGVFGPGKKRGYPDPKSYRFKHVFHQVRNPLDVISSRFYNDQMEKKTWPHVYKHIPQIKPTEPLIVRVAKYWYYWNLEAEKKAEWRYRIEDIDQVFDEICERLGVDLDRTSLEEISKSRHTKNPIESKITWADLKKNLSRQDFSNLQRLAAKYGYPTTD